MAEQNTFSRYAALYDLIYGDRDSVGEVEWIQDNLTTHGLASSATLLELGSGTGRHAHLLAGYGHTVTGVETSKEMLSLAHESDTVHFVRGDARTARLDQIFDCVLALFHVVSYQVTPADIDGIFETAAIHTGSGGLFGFDIWFSPAVHYLKPEGRELSRSNDQLSVIRKANPVENLRESSVTVNYSFEITDANTGEQERFDESHLMRHFSAPEIELYATKHGFTVLYQGEFLTDAEPSRDTWGVWFTLRKD